MTSDRFTIEVAVKDVEAVITLLSGLLRFLTVLQISRDQGLFYVMGDYHRTTHVLKTANSDSIPPMLISDEDDSGGEKLIGRDVFIGGKLYSTNFFCGYYGYLVPLSDETGHPLNGELNNTRATLKAEKEFEVYRRLRG